ncbi:DUF3613 domain-containing protein [Pseudoduganella namucuonensis]|uniref:Pilus assembly protein n=1 Tax=Pseudoduganella namucuonensis TaxID=1035707 RepID=A0A1I7LL09_9BURK|nr:DUF3613 domain-containing protein [Pseudoduganella namucuonensis]SFV10377.1 Protein of unknown function [Pseudoduganella namucuonensis]
MKPATQSALKPATGPAAAAAARSAAVPLLALCLLLAGCAAPRAPQPFGVATRSALALQVANPAPAAAGRAAGIDGATAARAHERYLKSYAAPARQPDVFAIGAGEGK